MPQRFLQFDIDSLNDVNVLDMDEAGSDLFDGLIGPLPQP